MCLQTIKMTGICGESEFLFAAFKHYVDDPDALHELNMMNSLSVQSRLNDGNRATLVAFCCAIVNEALDNNDPLLYSVGDGDAISIPISDAIKCTYGIKFRDKPE